MNFSNPWLQDKYPHNYIITFLHSIYNPANMLKISIILPPHFWNYLPWHPKKNSRPLEYIKTYSFFAIVCLKLFVNSLLLQLQVLATFIQSIEASIHVLANVVEILPQLTATGAWKTSLKNDIPLRVSDGQNPSWSLHGGSLSKIHPETCSQCIFHWKSVDCQAMLDFRKLPRRTHGWQSRILVDMQGYRYILWTSSIETVGMQRLL